MRDVNEIPDPGTAEGREKLYASLRTEQNAYLIDQLKAQHLRDVADLETSNESRNAAETDANKWHSAYMELSEKIGTSEFKAAEAVKIAALEAQERQKAHNVALQEHWRLVGLWTVYGAGAAIAVPLVLTIFVKAWALFSWAFLG